MLAGTVLSGSQGSWALDPAKRFVSSRARPALLGQVAVVGLFVLAYDRLRALAPGRSMLAFADSTRVLRCEWVLHLDPEHALNAWLASRHTLALLASTYYDTAHFLVSLPLLAVVYVRSPAQYRWLRNVLALTNALALLGFAFFPLAPPRMLPGYVDTVAVTHALGGWGTSLSTQADELAAMPSLHTAWALWCALAVFALTRRRWVRGLAIAHVALTVLVILGTGNHYLADVIAGAACLILSTLITHHLFRGRRQFTPWRPWIPGMAAEERH